MCSYVSVRSKKQTHQKSFFFLRLSVTAFKLWVRGLLPHFITLHWRILIYCCQYNDNPWKINLIRHIYVSQDEKYLVLKRRSNDQSPINSPEPSLSYSSSYSSLPSGAPLSPAMDPTLIPSFSKQPPPYRSPPPVTPPKVLPSPGMCMSPASSESSMEKTPPPVPPRRRSSDKIKFNNKENESLEGQRNSTTSDDGEVRIKLSYNLEYFASHFACFTRCWKTENCSNRA